MKKPTDTVVANTKEDRELLCEIASGNPLPKIKWEEQAHSCTTDQCRPLDNQWKPVTQVSFAVVLFFSVLCILNGFI